MLWLFLLVVGIWVVIQLSVYSKSQEMKVGRKKAARVLERMTREEIIAVLQRAQTASDAADRDDTKQALVNAIVKIRDRLALGEPHDSDVAALMKKAHEALNRYAMSADSQRGVERLAAGVLSAWARAPGGAVDAQAQIERLAAAAFDILVRHARDEGDTISDDDELVAVALTALTSSLAAGTPMPPRAARVVARALNTLDPPAPQPG